MVKNLQTTFFNYMLAVDMTGARNWKAVKSVFGMAKLEDILEAFQTNITEEKMKKTGEIIGLCTKMTVALLFCKV